MPPPVESALPENVVLFDYYQYTTADGLGLPTNERRLAVFVVRSGQAADEPVIHLDLGPLEAVEKAIVAWRQNIQAGGGAVRGDRRRRPKSPSVETSSLPQFQLRDLIWSPLTKYLNADDTVLVSPDVGLSFVPFSALPATTDDRYLIEERPIAVAPAPRLIIPLKSLASLGQPGAEREKTRQGVLLVGDVNFDAQRETNSKAVPSGFAWAPLPGTKKEIAAIDGLYREFLDSQHLTVLSGRSGQ